MTFESSQQIDYTLMGSTLMSSWVDSPAPTSASPERAQASPGHSPACGPSSPGSLGRYDPATHSLKTWQLSLVEDWNECSVTLPRSGTMRSGRLYPRHPWARPTGGSASGLLPTPVAKDDGKSFEAHMAMKERMGRNTCSSLAVMARSGMWPTPRANENDQGDANRQKMLDAGSSWKGQHRGATLTTSVLAAQMWPTPQAHDAAPGNASRVGRYGTEHGGRNLNDWVALWQTPVADDAMDRVAGKFNSRGEPKLSAQVKLWPTPRADGHDAGGTDPTRSLYTAVRSDDAVGGSLNPQFCEFLMGLPCDWTLVP